MTFSFGTPAAKPASSGFSFGNTANNSTTTPTRQSSFNFGANSTTASNTAINSGSASGFSFGSSTPAKTTTTTGSSGGFSFGKTDTNANKPATSTGGFSFGNTSSTTNTTAKPATTGGFSFGGSSSTTNKTGTSTGFSFGNFGKSSTTGTSSFSFGNTTTNNNNQNQQQNAELKNVLTPEDYKDQLAMALTCPQLYGDERDGIVAKWNQLQAAWGSGIAYRHNNQEPIKLTEKNMYCRFKAIGYTRMPSNRDKDGLVHLQVAKSAETVRGAQKDFVGFLQSLLGNQVNLVIKVDSINDLPDDKCEIVIYIQEQMKISNENIGSFDIEASTSTASSSFRVPTSIVYSNLKQHAEKLKNAGIIGIKNRVAMTEEQINEYLDNAPPGISEIQWNNAKKFNPDPKILLPVPLHGFDSLSRQHNHQRLLTEQQLVMISQIKEKMQNLQENNNERVAKLEKYKDKANLLKRKVLRLIARQELARNQSMNVNANNYNNNFGGPATNPLSKDEEVLLGGLEHVNKQWSNKIKAADRLYDIKTMLKNMGQEVNLNIDNKFEKSGDNIFNDTLDMDTSHVSNFDEGEEKNLISASQEKFMDKDLEEYMTKMLSKHQVQLDCMSSLIEGDMRDLAILVEDMKAN